MSGKRILSVLILLVLSGVLVADTPVTSCGQTLSSPGTYIMTSDLTGCTGKGIIFGANNITLDCQGHMLAGNCPLYPNNCYGIYLTGISGNVIKNCIVNNFGYGIMLNYSSNSNTLTNDIANNNSEYGIFLKSSSNNILTNITANGAINYGFYLSSSSNNILTNIMASSNLIGVYLDSSSSNNILSKVIANSNQYGVYLLSSSNKNILTNVIANSNQYGFYLSSSSNNILTNVIANSNTVYGIILDSSSNNIIANSTVSSTGNVGIWLYSAGSSGPNYFYNNLFNNTNNIITNLNGTVYPNYWNTTKQIGTRIYSNGIYLGGNYYTNPSGNGYSDTCPDADKDGFCDTPYTLATNNIDYLPLSKNYVVTCLAAYCSGNNLCTYSGPSCTLTCTACPASSICTSGTCHYLPGGSPIIRKCLEPNGCGPYSYGEDVPAQPTADASTYGVIIVAIIGLGIGYFVMRSYMAASMGSKKR